MHERDTQTDQLLLMLKMMLPSRPDLKVVLMSATVQAEVFSRYFEGASVLTAKGRTFPVEEHYLEQTLKLTGHALPADSPCRLRSNGEWNKASFAVHNRAITQEWQEKGANINPGTSPSRPRPRPRPHPHPYPYPRPHPPQSTRILATPSGATASVTC